MIIHSYAHTHSWITELSDYLLLFSIFWMQSTGSYNIIVSHSFYSLHFYVLGFISTVEVNLFSFTGFYYLISIKFHLIRSICVLFISLVDFPPPYYCCKFLSIQYSPSHKITPIKDQPSFNQITKILPNCPPLQERPRF